MLRRGLTMLLELVLSERAECVRFAAAIHPECAGELPRADGVSCLRCWMPSQVSAVGAICERYAGGARLTELDGHRQLFSLRGQRPLIRFWMRSFEA
jgi:hypothetical protein